MLSGKAGCGLHYAVKKSGSAVGYCALSIKCGTRDEASYNAGIAHFVEHTIFKGTKNKSASVINSYLDRLGGELNAFTTKEEIVFHATVLKEDLNRAASLLFELVTCPIFPENEIQTEKGVVIDEIHSYKDSPAEDVYDKFEEMIFKGHPLSGNILGTVVSVKKITRDELLNFVRDKFKPCKMAFSVVADIDEAKMEKGVLKLAEKYFSTGAGCQELAECEIREDAPLKCGNYSLPQPEQFSRTITKRNHQANCVIGSLAPSLYEKRERLATVLLCNILGGPANNSILNAILREKYGWVYGVECGYIQFSDTGLVSITLGCDKANLEKCIAVNIRDILKLQQESMSERRFKAAKKQLLGQLAISGDNGEAQCLSMGKSLLAYGKIFDSKDNRELVDSITAEDLREMAQRIFEPS